MTGFTYPVLSAYSAPLPPWQSHSVTTTAMTIIGKGSSKREYRPVLIRLHHKRVSQCSYVDPPTSSQAREPMQLRRSAYPPPAPHTVLVVMAVLASSRTLRTLSDGADHAVMMLLVVGSNSNGSHPSSAAQIFTTPPPASPPGIKHTKCDGLARHCAKGVTFAAKRREKPKRRQPEYSKQRENSLKRLNFDNYDEYLESDLWREIRQSKLAVDPNCECCGHSAEQVHHISYAYKIMAGVENKCLVSVCRDCHVILEFTKSGRKRGFIRVVKLTKKLIQAWKLDNNQRC